MLVTLLPFCHASRCEKFMLHSQITPILFTTIKQETYTVENVAYACFSNNGNDDIDDAYVYEMKCK